jgi:hypothetical protein
MRILKELKYRDEEYGCVIIVTKKGGLREERLNVSWGIIRNKDEN